MKIFGVVGWKNSGKTTLIVKLVEEFVRRGYRVSTLKHAHHAFDIDRPGKDSYRHREAGATEVLIASGARWALVHELRDEPEPDLDELRTHIAPADLLLVEGFKKHDHPKIQVAWNGQDGDILVHDDPSIRAVVTNVPDLKSIRPVIQIDAIEEIANFIAGEIGLGKKPIDHRKEEKSRWA
ncbi:MAG: molybdopterin-guanine dinucleotide biosynthesis protein B [Sphingomonadales bacterium]